MSTIVYYLLKKLNNELSEVHIRTFSNIHNSHFIPNVLNLRYGVCWTLLKFDLIDKRHTCNLKWTSAYYQSQKQYTCSTNNTLVKFKITGGGKKISNHKVYHLTAHVTKNLTYCKYGI